MSGAMQKLVALLSKRIFVGPLPLADKNLVVGSCSLLFFSSQFDYFFRNRIVCCIRYDSIVIFGGIGF